MTLQYKITLCSMYLYEICKQKIEILDILQLKYINSFISSNFKYHIIISANYMYLVILIMNVLVYILCLLDKIRFKSFINTDTVLATMRTVFYN